MRPNLVVHDTPNATLCVVDWHLNYNLGLLAGAAVGDCCLRDGMRRELERQILRNYEDYRDLVDSHDLRCKGVPLVLHEFDVFNIEPVGRADAGSLIDCCR